MLDRNNMYVINKIPLSYAIIELLKESGEEGISVDDVLSILIRQRSGVDRRKIASTLGRLKREGRVTKMENGMWKVPAND